MTTEPHRIMLSTGFLRRRHYNKVLRQELIRHGLRPVDALHDGVPFPDSAQAAVSKLMGEVDGYLTVIDTQHIMKPDKSDAEQLTQEFHAAVESGLPIGLLVVGRRDSAPKYVDKRLEQIADQFRSFHARNSKDLRSLMVLEVNNYDYLSGMRDLMGLLRARLEQPDDPGLVAIPPTIPDQSPAPIRIEERDGRISQVSDRDSPLSVAERDFNDWREPVLDHILELLSGDFCFGTNHSRARERLAALSTLFTGGVPDVKERQFHIGYQIERLEGLIVAYRSGVDDMPVLNAAVLEDLNRLRIALVMGIGKLERWSEFHRAAAVDPLREGSASPGVVGAAINEIAAEMEAQPRYFDPELPRTFRFLAEATADPVGATKTVVFGTVKSTENLMVFLGQRALNIGRNAAGAVEQHISKAVAASLIVTLSAAALRMSGALPTPWTWLKPLLDALAKGGGG